MLKKIKKYYQICFKFLKNLKQEYVVRIDKNSPIGADVIIANDPWCYISEQYRNLAGGLINSEPLKGAKAFVFTSPQPRDGKSTTVANIAYSLAKYYNKKTLIIDGDLRRPNMHKLFKIPLDAGLYEILTNNLPAEPALRTIVPNLDLITAGNLDLSNKSYLSNTILLAYLIRVMKTKYDYVLFDSPPILKVSDAGIIGGLVDRLVLIIRAQTTPEHVITEAQATLTTHNSPAAGTMLINCRREVDLYNYIMNPHYRNYYSDFYTNYGKE